MLRLPMLVDVAYPVRLNKPVDINGSTGRRRTLTGIEAQKIEMRAEVEGFTYSLPVAVM